MLRSSLFKISSTLSLLALTASLLAGGITAQDKAATQKPKPARDPFDTAPWQKRATPRPVVAPKITPKVVAVAKPTPPPPSLVKEPEIQDRVSFYREEKRAYIAEGKMPPKPTTAFLLNEIEVSGIFRTPRGYAAMVFAKPINLSYVMYPGEKLFDSQLVAIDEDHLVFRQHRKWSDGRTEDRVERKSLRQPNLNELKAEKTEPGRAVAPATNETAAPAAPTGEAAPAIAAPKVSAPANLAGDLLNSLPSRSEERDTGKPATEFSAAPAPKSAPATTVKPARKTPAKGKAVSPKKAAPKTP